MACGGGGMRRQHVGDQAIFSGLSRCDWRRAGPELRRLGKNATQRAAVRPRDQIYRAARRGSYFMSPVTVGNRPHESVPRARLT
eukprot:1082772-Prymnesium_polylepis.1